MRSLFFSEKQIKAPAETKLVEYPLYPTEEDIYKQAKEETNLDPEDITTDKSDQHTEEPAIGSDLDIPGSELDDQQESIGSEDEENNYYSIGGDAHIDLEEE